MRGSHALRSTGFATNAMNARTSKSRERAENTLFQSSYAQQRERELRMQSSSQNDYKQMSYMRSSQNNNYGHQTLDDRNQQDNRENRPTGQSEFRNKF